MEIHPFYIFSVFIIIFILIVVKRFFSVPSSDRRALAQAEEGKKLKEFALHHFNELKKINPTTSLNDNFPENVFPAALIKILKIDNPSREDQMDAITAINIHFTQHQKTNDINYINKRVKVQRNSIFINNSFSLRNRQIEIQPIIELEGEIPSISIYEDSKLIRRFDIEPLLNNSNLNGQYLYSSIRINENSSVQIDGIISDSESTYDVMGEGIRFQPFFLSDKEEENQKLKGLGMFDRGLHYVGLVTPSNVRLVCTCDECSKSFGVQFMHAGFAEVQYFYSSNSKETLIVPYDNKLGPVPHQTQKDFDENLLIEIESKLPTTIDGKFEYYNAFKCPHCFADFINFRENKHLRPREYYAYKYCNNKYREI